MSPQWNRCKQTSRHTCSLRLASTTTICKKIEIDQNIPNWNFQHDSKSWQLYLSTFHQIWHKRAVSERCSSTRQVHIFQVEYFESLTIININSHQNEILNCRKALHLGCIGQCHQAAACGPALSYCHLSQGLPLASLSDPNPFLFVVFLAPEVS